MSRNNPLGRQKEVESFLMLVGAVAVFVGLLSILGWMIQVLIGFTIGVLSVVTVDAVLISLFAGVATFVTGVATYNSWQEARMKKELADTFEEIDDYEAKIEAWKEHIQEQEEHEKRERELETEGGSQ
ncbi:hypothetical protein [Haloarcula quadrata]|nr:hypothetical protein [Haloarcula quadrata]